jgi:hypothetical protein
MKRIKDMFNFGGRKRPPQSGSELVSDPKADCEDVMNVLMPFAEEMLTKHREFFPFGGTMWHNGEISLSGGTMAEENPSSSEVIALIEEAFRTGAERGEYRATGLVYDIRTVPPGKQDKQDAIAVALDHRDNYSVVVVFPYTFTAKGELAIETPFATSGEHKIFAR